MFRREWLYIFEFNNHMFELVLFYFFYHNQVNTFYHSFLLFIDILSINKTAISEIGSAITLIIKQDTAIYYCQLERLAQILKTVVPFHVLFFKFNYYQLPA